MPLLRHGGDALRVDTGPVTTFSISGSVAKPVYSSPRAKPLASRLAGKGAHFFSLEEPAHRMNTPS